MAISGLVFIVLGFSIITVIVHYFTGRWSFAIGAAVVLNSLPALLISYEYYPETMPYILLFLRPILLGALATAAGIGLTVWSEKLLARNPKWVAAIAARDYRWKIICKVEELWASGVRQFDGHTQCFFCGADNRNDPVGYAGERCCHVCGNGGSGESSMPTMFNEEWYRRFG